MSTPTPPEVELPPVDGVTEPWWDATREQRLLIQRCTSCGRLQHYPRALCAAGGAGAPEGGHGCGGTDLDWVQAAGTGTVDSFTVVHRGLPGFDAPYVVARVRLTEGVVLLTNLVDVPLGEAGDASAPEPVRCDDPVTLRWRALPDGRHLPVFAPA